MAETLNLKSIFTGEVFEDLKVDPSGADYEAIDKLLSRKIGKFPTYLTPAMKEYFGSRLFSPYQEKKKNENIEKFFLVSFTQEKYQIINSVFHESKKNQKYNSALRVDEKKTGESNEKVKEKEKIMDPFDLRIKGINDKILKEVDIQANLEKLKRNEEERKALDVNFNKRQKNTVSLGMKFSNLNLKAKHRINNLSKLLEIDAKTTRGIKHSRAPSGESFDESMEKNALNLEKLIVESGKLHLPEIHPKKKSMSCRK